MKKRLRKKLHRGEFQELGFQISWQFTPALSAPEDDQFFDALIEMVEAAGLSFGGGGSKLSVKIGSLEDAWHNPHPDFEMVKDWIERDAKRVVLPKAKS